MRTPAPFALALILALALAACESAPPTATPSVDTTESATATATAAAGPDVQPTISTSTPTSASDATPTAFPVGFGPGTWHVSSEVAPGVYEATDISGTCEWARLSRLDGDSAEVLFEDSTTAPVTVAILLTDAGFRASEECGRWVFQPSPTPTPTPTPLDFRAPELHTTLSSGPSHTCALRPNSTAVCWGSNFRGKSSPTSGRAIHIYQQWGPPHMCTAPQWHRLLLGRQRRWGSIASRRRSIRIH